MNKYRNTQLRFNHLQQLIVSIKPYLERNPSAMEYALTLIDYLSEQVDLCLEMLEILENTIDHMPISLEDFIGDDDETDSD